MKPIRALLAVLPAAALLASAWPAAAKEIDLLGNLTQAEFRSLSEDLGSALSYKPLAPTAPLGLLGFDVGVAATGTKLQHKDLFNKASSVGGFSDTVVVPTVRAIVGLPWGFDVHAMYAAVPDTSAKLYGGALSWAFVSGNVAMPAIGVRGSYTQTRGINQLDFSAAGVDVSISKGFAFVTPYGGVGRNYVSSTPSSATGLRAEEFGQNKVFAGLNFNVLLMNLALEWDRTGFLNSYGAKLGLRF
jgi:hypothetical protein